MTSEWHRRHQAHVLRRTAGVAMSAHVQFPNLLPPTGGFVVLVGYAAATLLVAALTLRRREA